METTEIIAAVLIALVVSCLANTVRLFRDAAARDRTIERLTADLERLRAERRAHLDERADWAQLKTSAEKERLEHSRAIEAWERWARAQKQWTAEQLSKDAAQQQEIALLRQVIAGLENECTGRESAARNRMYRWIAATALLCRLLERRDGAAPNKIGLIKAIKDFTWLGLQEVQALVEAVLAQLPRSSAAPASSSLTSRAGRGLLERRTQLGQGVNEGKPETN